MQCACSPETVVWRQLRKAKMSWIARKVRISRDVATNFPELWGAAVYPKGPQSQVPLIPLPRQAWVRGTKHISDRVQKPYLVKLVGRVAAENILSLQPSTKSSHGSKTVSLLMDPKELLPPKGQSHEPALPFVFKDKFYLWPVWKRLLKSCLL